MQLKSDFSLQRPISEILERGAYDGCGRGTGSSEPIVPHRELSKGLGRVKPRGTDIVALG